MLVWSGSDNSTIFNVTAPRNISLEQIQFIFDGRLFKNITDIHQTSDTACSMNYDGMFENRIATAHTPDMPGLVLDALPVGSHVTSLELAVPLTVHDCGPAEILINYSLIGRIIVDGATHPKTGFLGIINTENGTMTPGPDFWNILVNDNQNLFSATITRSRGITASRSRAASAPGRATLQSPVSSRTSIIRRNGMPSISITTPEHSFTAPSPFITWFQRTSSRPGPTAAT